MPREHGDDGAFIETISLEDVLGVFDAVDGPVILSADVADRLGCSRETARRKLATLYDRGDLARRKVARRMIYWQAADRPTESTEAAEPITAALDGWTHGRGEAERSASRTVAARATEWLRARGEAVRRADVPLDEFASEDPLSRAEDTLWSEVVRSAWQHAADRGYIAQPHSRAYQWTGAPADE